MPEGQEPESTSHRAEQPHEGQPSTELHHRPTARPRPRRPAESPREGWAAFITRAAHVLASTLDYHTTVENILGLVVPRLADWCVATLADDNGRVYEVAARHGDPVRDEL